MKFIQPTLFKVLALFCMTPLFILSGGDELWEPQKLTNFVENTSPETHSHETETNGDHGHLHPEEKTPKEAPKPNSGHSHESGGAHPPHGEMVEELGPHSITQWDDKIEIFMEYGPLLSRIPSKFIIHLTYLSDFSPILEGSLKISFEKGGRVLKTHFLLNPKRDGIFVPEIPIEESGKYRMILELNGKRGVHKILVEDVVVYPNKREAKKGISHKEGGGEETTYLKEQQWANDFSTTTAHPGMIRNQIRTQGRIETDWGKKRVISAPIGGKILFLDPPEQWIPGKQVHINDEIGKIIPPPSLLELMQLRNNSRMAILRAQIANQKLSRVEELFKQGAIPSKRVQETREDAEMARLEMRLSKENLEVFNSSSGSSESPLAFSIPSPGNFRVVQVLVSPDQTVNQGDPLLHLENWESLLINCPIFESDSSTMEGFFDARLYFPALDKEFTLDQMGIKAVGFRGTIDPRNHTYPFYLRIQKPDPRLVPGMFVSVTHFTGKLTYPLVIPFSALFEEGGETFVFVHSSGEGFTRQVVTTGPRDVEKVSVLSGLRPGQRVVVRGGYKILLASKSSVIPSHGHSH